MSVFTNLKHPKQSKVLNSQYIKTQDQPADEAETKPAEPASPAQPETK